MIIIVQICPMVTMVSRLTKLLSTLEECRLHNSRDRFMSSPHFLTSLDLHALMHYTVGADRNETLVFVHFSAQDASISKISVPIIKRKAEDSKTAKFG